MEPEELYQVLGTNGIRDVKALIAELEGWNEDKRFYRRWYELRHDRKALAEFVNSFDLRALRKRNMILPEELEQTERDGTEIVLQMAYFFPPSQRRNVFLYKHNRYSPAFEHRHDYFEIFLVLRGQCTNTMAGRRMTLDAGKLCFIAPGAHHTIEVFDESLVINLMIKRSTFDEVFLNMLTTTDILSLFFMGNIYHRNSAEYMVFNIADDAELLEQFFAMFIEQRREDKQSNRIIEGRLSIFFSLLMRKYGNSPVVYEQVGLKERYWQIIAYINEHFRTLSLAKVAARFNLSAAYCSRIIKSVIGKNFTALVRDLRMKAARAMLTSSQAKIHEISFSLGYENQETFIRDFKKHSGVTPTQYRSRLPERL